VHQVSDVLQQEGSELLGTLTYTSASVAPLSGNALTDASSACNCLYRVSRSDLTLASSRFAGIPRATAATMSVTNDSRKNMALRVKGDVGGNGWFDEEQSTWPLLNPGDGLHGKGITLQRGPGGKRAA